jgi:hypothetical protein
MSETTGAQHTAELGDDPGRIIANPGNRESQHDETGRV